MTPRYDAVVFDLLSALLDSWSLWDGIAGSPEAGRRWRMAYLERTYATGSYRPYEELVREAAGDVGFPESYAQELTDRWAEVEPWPEAPEVVEALARELPLGIVTNCSEAGAATAAARVGDHFTVLMTAERAGWYKPDERPYRRALEELGVAPERALYVAGSPLDVPGAGAVGMPVFWHNRPGLEAAEGADPIAEARSLRPLLELVLE